MTKRGDPAADPWTAENVETMRRMWLQGATSGEIARAIRVTRNAVCGKLNHLGLERPQGLSQTNKPEGFSRGARTTNAARKASPAQKPPTPATPNEEWPEADVAKLRAMRAEGRSYAEIGKALDRTRNSCLTKGNRLGLSKPLEEHRKPKSQPGSVLRTTKRFDVGAQPKLQVVHPAAPSSDGRIPGAPTSLMLSIEQLSLHTCRWPIGTPGEDGFGFCGNRTAGGKVYCGFHCARAFTRVSAQLANGLDVTAAPIDFRRRA